MDSERSSLAREEIHHRFLNTLTALHGLLRRDFDGFEDPMVREAVTTFEGQLMAFAGIHRSLQGREATDMIDVPGHFARLCAQLCSVHLAPQGHYCDFSADDGEIHATAGEKLGLIVAELVTNCAKHAFKGSARGRVAISLRKWDGGWICMVQDNGAGMRAGPAGQGLRLVEDLARSIDADVAVHSNEDGVRTIVRLPSPKATVAGECAQGAPLGTAPSAKLRSS